jgi:hypothetical protein
MKYWIMQKYQPEIKAGLIKGYIADDKVRVFEGITPIITFKNEINI